MYPFRSVWIRWSVIIHLDCSSLCGFTTWSYYSIHHIFPLFLFQFFKSSQVCLSWSTTESLLEECYNETPSEHCQIREGPVVRLCAFSCHLRSHSVPCYSGLQHRMSRVFDHTHYWPCTRNRKRWGISVIILYLDVNKFIWPIWEKSYRIN